MIDIVDFRFTAGELKAVNDVGDAGGWFSLLYRLLCTGLSNDDSARLRLLILKFVLRGWRIFWCGISGIASKLRRFLAGEYGLFSLSINPHKSIKSSSIIGNEFDPSCEGLIGHGWGLDGGLRWFVKNDVSSDISKSNLVYKEREKNSINFWSLWNFWHSSNHLVAVTIEIEIQFNCSREWLFLDNYLEFWFS